MRGRPLVSQNPLFPGYVFLLGTDADRVGALTTQRVVRALSVADQEKLWRDLCQIRRLLESGAPLTPQTQLRPGVKIEITGGVLAGLQGTILRTASGCRFVVAVDFIQQGAAVELDESYLARAC